MKNIYTKISDPKYFKSICYLYHNSLEASRNQLFEYLLVNNIWLAAKCISTCEYDAIHEGKIVSKTKKIIRSSNNDDLSIALNVLTEVDKVELIVSHYNNTDKRSRWLIAREIRKLLPQLDNVGFNNLLQATDNNDWLTKIIIEYAEQQDNINKIMDVNIAISKVSRIFSYDKKLALNLCIASKLSYRYLNQDIINYIVIQINLFIHDGYFYDAIKLCNNIKIHPKYIPDNLDYLILTALTALNNNDDIELMKEIERHCRLYEKAEMLTLIMAKITTMNEKMMLLEAEESRKKETRKQATEAKQHETEARWQETNAVSKLIFEGILNIKTEIIPFIVRTESTRHINSLKAVQVVSEVVATAILHAVAEVEDKLNTKMVINTLPESF